MAAVTNKVVAHLTDTEKNILTSKKFSYIKNIGFTYDLKRNNLKPGGLFFNSE